MTKDDDLVKRLRLGACALEIEQAADRIEALEAKLAKAFVIMEREIKRVQQLRQDFQANSKKPLRVSLFDVQCEYEDILAEMKGDKT